MKLSHLLYFGLMTLVIIVSGAYAGAVIKGNGVYQIEIDNAKFFGDDSSIYVEVYYGVRERILEYHEVNGVFSGNAMMKLNIYKDSVLASSKEWHVPHTLEDTSNIKSGKTLIGIETFAVPAGNYRVDFIS